MATNRLDAIPEKVWRAILKEAAKGTSRAELARKWGPKIEHEYGVKLTAAGIGRRVKTETVEKPVGDIVAELLAIFADVPDEEFARWPSDGADQHDHYIYGTPKRRR